MLASRILGIIKTTTLAPFFLACCVYAQESPILIDSERARQLMQNYHACMKGGELSHYYNGITTCATDDGGMDKSCAEALDGILIGKEYDPHDYCKHLIPNVASVLQDHS